MQELQLITIVKVGVAFWGTLMIDLITVRHCSVLINISIIFIDSNVTNRTNTMSTSLPNITARRIYIKSKTEAVRPANPGEYSNSHA